MESANKFRMKSTAADSGNGMGKPCTGPYYWIPLPREGWELISFAQKPSGSEIGHVDIWSDVLRVIAEKWGKDPDKLVRRMGDHPYALPRGRVVKLGPDRWGIAHGNDTPPEMSLSMVRRCFHLPQGKTEIFHDEHEVMIAEHLSALERDLKTSFGLEAPVPPDFDD